VKTPAFRTSGALARLAEHEASANELVGLGAFPARPGAAVASRCNAVALGTSLNLFLRIAAGTIAGFPRESLELGQWHRECSMRGKQIKFQSDSVMADVYLGVTVAGLYTLVGMGLIIVFM
jgi:hypothetical protein